MTSLGNALQPYRKEQESASTNQDSGIHGPCNRGLTTHQTHHSAGHLQVPRGQRLSRSIKGLHRLELGTARATQVWFGAPSNQHRPCPRPPSRGLAFPSDAGLSTVRSPIVPTGSTQPSGNRGAGWRYKGTATQPSVRSASLTTRTAAPSSELTMVTIRRHREANRPISRKVTCC
jgi:hypothetical protein